MIDFVWYVCWFSFLKWYTYFWSCSIIFHAQSYLCLFKNQVCHSSVWRNIVTLLFSMSSQDFYIFFLHSTDSFHWKLAVSFLHVLFHWNLDWVLFSTLYIVLYFTFVSYMLASILFMSYYFIFIVFSLILQNCFQISYFTMFVFVFQYKFCHFSQFSRKPFNTT